MQQHARLAALKLCLLMALVAVALLWPKPTGASGVTVAAVVSGSGSSHTCALTKEGGVKCWGWNRNGQLGDGSVDDRAVPVDVAGLDQTVIAVATGQRHSCALTAPGGVRCWGSNLSGQLGDGGACGTLCLAPVQVTGLTSGVTAIAAGYLHTCALTGEGGVKCWGNNLHGQLGNGQVGSGRSTPVAVFSLASGVASLAAGDWHTCAVTQAGGAKCWGENVHGQLGNGTAYANISQPVNVSGLGSGVVAVAPASVHTCALTVADVVLCWGKNDSGQLGNGTAGGLQLTPAEVPGLTNASGLAAGFRHSCAVIASSGIKCWGRNDDGELGDGGDCVSPCLSPVNVLGLMGSAVAVTAGEGHTCALVEGGIRCWGRNNLGQLGDGTFGGERAVPQGVSGLGPLPVGGIAELPTPLERSAARAVGPVAALVAGAVALVLAVGGLVWRCTRRDGSGHLP